MTSERAFSTLFFLLPLLLSLTLVLSGVVLILNIWSRSTHLCREQTLMEASLLSSGIQQLFKLNSGATRLRLKFDRARAREIATRPEPPAHAVALARLAQVTAEQIRFRFKQRAVIEQTEREARRQSSEMFMQLKRLGARGLSTTPIALAVRPIQIGSLTPDYETVPNFETVQSVRTSWSIDRGLWIPNFLQDLLPKVSELKGSCAATVRKTATQLEPGLMKIP